MAGIAGADYLRVIDRDDWCPGAGVMTCITHITGAYMAGRFVCRVDTIVTRLAGLAAYQAMIKGDVPVSGAMAGITGIRCCDMCWALALC